MDRKPLQSLEAEQVTRERDEALQLLRAAQTEREAVADEHERELNRLERERDDAAALLRECYVALTMEHSDRWDTAATQLAGRIEAFLRQEDTP